MAEGYRWCNADGLELNYRVWMTPVPDCQMPLSQFFTAYAGLVSGDGKGVSGAIVHYPTGDQTITNEEIIAWISRMQLPAGEELKWLERFPRLGGESALDPMWARAVSESHTRACPVAVLRFGRGQSGRLLAVQMVTHPDAPLLHAVTSFVRVARSGNSFEL